MNMLKKEYEGRRYYSIFPTIDGCCPITIVNLLGHYMKDLNFLNRNKLMA